MIGLNCSEFFAKTLDYYFQCNDNSDLFELEGNSLSIEIKELSNPIAIQIKNGRVISFEQADEVADVQISGNFKAIINMIRNENGLETDELFIQGKLSKAKQFHQLLSSLTLDWQWLFEKIVDKEKATILADKANQLQQCIKSGFSDHKNSQNTNGLLGMANSALNKWFDEQQKIVTKSEFSEFTSQLNLLALKIDGLMKKTADLTQVHSKATNEKNLTEQ